MIRSSFAALAALLVAAAPASAQIAVDGQLVEPEYRLLATDTGGPTLGFGPLNQLNALYAYAVPTSATEGTLYLGLAGRVERSGNSVLVFLDTRTGGYNTGDYGRAGAPGAAGTFNSGHQFDTGFLADYVLNINCNAVNPDNCFFNLYTLSGSAATGGSGGPDNYLGSSADANGRVAASFPANGDENSRTRGFEVALTYSATGTGAVLALDRTSVQAFSLITSADGFVSNQFLTPTNAGDGNYGFDAQNFETKAADPASLVWQTLAGRQGWRHLAWPVGGGTVAHLAAQNHVQGVAESYPSGGPNVILGWDGTQWEYATSTTNPLTSGLGQFWYHYNAADFPSGQPEPGFKPLPYTLYAGGVEPQANVVRSLVGTSDNYYLLGNPFALAFDLAGLDETATNFNVGALAYVWDPNAGTAGGYVVRDRTSPTLATRTIDAMQGVFVELTAPAPPLTGLSPQFAFSQSARVSDAPFYGVSPGERRLVALELVRDTPAGPMVEDQTARLLFAADATEGTDYLDSTEPPGFAGIGAHIAFASVSGGAGVHRAQESRPLSPASVVSVPLALRIAGLPEGAAYRLRWPTVENVPAEWTLRLLDLQTGSVVDLRAAAEYAFSASPTEWTERFVVEASAGAVASDSAPAAAAVGPATPNPVTGMSRVRVAVDRAQAVRADLYDALGRRVAVVFDATVSAGAGVDVAIEAARLAPGAYVLRITGETFSASRAVSVVR